MSAAKQSAWTAAVSGRWAALASRERVLVGSAATLIFVAVLWWVAISPALTQISTARAAAPALDAQWQLMRAQAQEAASLKSQRQLGYDESLRSLETSVKSLGAGAALSVNEARATITLKGVSGDALAQWLAQARANARLVPSELRLQKSTASAATATAALTSWDGSIAMSLPAR